MRGVSVRSATCRARSNGQRAVGHLGVLLLASPARRRAPRRSTSADLARRQGTQASGRPYSPPAGGRARRVPGRAAAQAPGVAILVRQPKGQPEPPRSLRASGAAQSGGRGRDLGGSGRKALCSPVASQLCHEPCAQGRGHPRRSAPDGPLQHRDHKPVLASLGRGSPRRRRPGVPRELSSATRWSASRGTFRATPPASSGRPGRHQ